MNTKTGDHKDLGFLENVVSGGYCVGCGACAAFECSPLSMRMNEYGLYEPVAESDHRTQDIAPGSVCPFFQTKIDEDTIGKGLFSEGSLHDPRVGYYKSIFAGYVTKKELREKTTSGGITTWLITRLFEEKLIDGVIHVMPASKHDILFEYSISYDVVSAVKGAKSRYYPVEFSEVIKLIRKKPGKYAFIGVPCFVKAIRLLSNVDPVINQSIKYCISIFCGHLKSAALAEYYSWQLGIRPEELRDFDFRVKTQDKPASYYSVKASGSRNGKIISVTSPANGLLGNDWGLGLFKPMACDYCDDIAGETADASMGDAWLPQYVNDSNGTNIAIIRNKILLDIVLRGIKDKQLKLDDIGPQEVYDSQQGNYRHRRDGLAYRLWLCDQQKLWRPQKREQPRNNHLSERRKLLIELRMNASQRSHIEFMKAKQRGNLSVFTKQMRRIEWQYYRVSGKLYRYILKTIYISIKRLIGK